MRFAAMFGSGVLVGLASVANAQYSIDFETLMGGAAGTALTGQDGYYLPTGVTSVDHKVFTYTGNPLGIPANPNGGDQFGVGVGPAVAGTFARAQRDFAWSAGQWRVSYDIFCNRDAVAPFANNVGSFSTQPSVGTNGYIHLFSYEETVMGTNWQALFLNYTAAGVQVLAPGSEPDPAFSNLTFGEWYHFETVIDYDANLITEVSIQNLTTGGPTVTANPTGYYLGGGTTPAPFVTALRMFAGNGTTGNNTVAWDNLTIEEEGGGCYPDCDMSGGLDFFDFLCFQNEFNAGCK